MIVLQIALVLVYFILASWLVLATFMNFVLKPYIHRHGFRADTSVAWIYAVLWGLALTAPVGYGLIFG